MRSKAYARGYLTMMRKCADVGPWGTTDPVYIVPSDQLKALRDAYSDIDEIQQNWVTGKGEDKAEALRAANMDLNKARDSIAYGVLGAATGGNEEYVMAIRNLFDKNKEAEKALGSGEPSDKILGGLKKLQASGAARDVENLRNRGFTFNPSQYSKFVTRDTMRQMAGRQGVAGLSMSGARLDALRKDPFDYQSADDLLRSVYTALDTSDAVRSLTSAVPSRQASTNTATPIRRW